MHGLRDSLFRYYLAWRYGVHLRKPRLLVRQLKTAAQVYLLRQPRLRYVDFSLDYPCNLKCDHCFNTSFAQQPPGRKKLCLEDYKKIAAECREMGAIAFSFQGGEPFLFLDRLEQVIEVFKPQSALISVTTNGTLGTRDNIRRLRKAGVDIFTISLDSGIAAEHDAFRGIPGTYDKAMHTMELALSEGLRVTIGTTVHHQNVRSEGIRRLIKFATSRRCQLVFALAVPAGEWLDNDEILLDDEDMKVVDQYCADNPLVRVDLCGNYLHWGCGAMKEIIYVTPYGDVLACPFLHISFGRAPGESLVSIRQRALKNPYLDKYWPGCLAATDVPFRQQVLAQLRGRDDLPVQAEQLEWPDRVQLPKR